MAGRKTDAVRADIEHLEKDGVIKRYKTIIDWEKAGLDKVKIHAYTALCAPITGQKAALEALAHGEQSVQEMVQQYGQRRRLIVEGLNEIGLPCHMPDAPFMPFPASSRLV